MMRKGFTLLELLVASLLFGMMMTILTMIFNQSAIAWRTGIAGISDLDEVRERVGRVRNEADNVYIWKENNPRVASIVSIWRSDAGSQTGAAKLRGRAVDFNNLEDVSQGEKIDTLLGCVSGTSNERQASQIVTQPSVTCGQGQDGGGDITYVINVKCAGPDREFGTYDDIWSYPDDFEL